jgi:ribonuclease P protein component
MQRHLRLRRKEDFDHLRRTGRVWRHPLLILSVAPNGLTHNRYGYVTSKQLGTAVARNLVRRWLREAVRHAHPHLKPGHDMAFIARRSVTGEAYAAVHEAVMTSLQQAGLWLSPGEDLL